MIAPETITQVRDRTDIVALIGETVKLKRQGRRFIGLCPFHQEKSPSFSVNQERAMFYCFGCKEAGSAIDFVMKVEGTPFPEAVRMLAERAGIEVKDDTSDQDRRLAGERRDRLAQLYRVSDLVCQYFEEQLTAHALSSLAMAELAKRELSPGSAPETDDALKAFRLGYAPYGWDSLSNALRKQGIDIRMAIELGVVSPRRSGDGIFDAFRHRLMFPVIDHMNRVVAFSGRALPEPETELLASLKLAPMSRPRRPENGEAPEPRRAPPKYINSPESPIYVKGKTVFGLQQARHAVRHSGQAVLVEGNFDVLALHARGLTTAVAPLGTAFTEEQGRLIKRYAPVVVVLFDGDPAGQKATVALRKSARDAQLMIKVASLPPGVDPDDLSRSHGIEAVMGLVKNAKGMVEFLIDQTLSQAGDATQEAIMGRIRRVMGYLAEETDPNARLLAKTYADSVASRLVISGRSPTDLRGLEAMVQKAFVNQRTPEGQQAARNHATVAEQFRSRSRPAYDLMHERVVGALLDFPELFDEPDIDGLLGAISGDWALLVGGMRMMWEKKSGVDAAELLDLAPQSVHSFAAGRLACPEHGERAAAWSAVIDNADKLREGAVKREKPAKVQEMAQTGDTSTEDEILRELAQQHKRRLKR